MARRRFLQPGFWTNPLLSKCPPLTRLMFQVIWTHADFDGAFQWDPEALAMKGLPRDNFDAEDALARLEHDGFIRSYVVEGKRFGYVVNWHKHQDPHPGEKPIYPRPLDAPDFQVKVKEAKWRKPGDTAFEAPEIERGLYPWVQLAGNLQTTCTEVAGRLPATDKEGKEGKESLYQEEPVPRLEPVPTKTKRRTRQEILRPYSERVRNVTNEILRVWPECDRSGRDLRVEVPTLVRRVEAILNEHPEIEDHHMIEAAKEYVQTDRKMLQAPQWFFGVGQEGNEAQWVAFVKMAIHRGRQQKEAPKVLAS